MMTFKASKYSGQEASPIEMVLQASPLVISKCGRKRVPLGFFRALEVSISKSAMTAAACCALVSVIGRAGGVS